MNQVYHSLEAAVYEVLQTVTLQVLYHPSV